MLKYNISKSDVIQKKIKYILPGLLVFFWTFPSSGILETRKHNVSETGSVSVLRYKGGEDTYSVEPLRKS
jgi:hypothetical protein